MILSIEGFDRLKGFNSYLINREGLVWSVLRGKYLKPLDNGIGYKQYSLVDYSGRIRINRQMKVHRLVALQYLPNPNNYTDVNHKNGIKSDNSVENLEWCTHKENILHSYRELGRTHDCSYLGKKIKCSNGKTYLTAVEASKDTDCRTSNISMCCNGKLKHTKKLKFEFI